jgi:hypothetical protein
VLSLDEVKLCEYGLDAHRQRQLAIVSNCIIGHALCSSHSGEHQEQLRLNFTRTQNHDRLTCRSRNTIGQSEASLAVNILCKFHE